MLYGIREIGALLLINLAELIAPSQRTKIALIRASTAYIDATTADIIEANDMRDARKAAKEA